MQATLILPSHVLRTKLCVPPSTTRSGMAPLSMMFYRPLSMMHKLHVHSAVKVAMSFWAVLILVFETGMPTLQRARELLQMCFAGWLGGLACPQPARLQLEYLQLEGGVSQEDARPVALAKCPTSMAMTWQDAAK